MNDDTISRQAAIDAIEKVDDYGDGIAFEVLSHAQRDISLLPSAERRGRWEDVEHATNGLLYATCSVCGKRQTIETTNYCGNCGADMREAKNGCDDCFIPMFYNLEDDDSICRDCEVGE